MAARHSRSKSSNAVAIPYDRKARSEILSENALYFIIHQAQIHASSAVSSFLTYRHLESGGGRGEGKEKKGKKKTTNIETPKLGSSWSRNIVPRLAAGD